MKTDEGVDLDAVRAVGTMVRLVRLVDAELRRASDSDLGLTDLSVLAEISRGTVSPSALACTLHLERPHITRVSDRLVSSGLVERAEDSTDRRRCRLTVTSSGQEFLHDSLQTVSAAVDRILGGLGVTRRASLLAHLADLRPEIDRASAAGGTSSRSPGE